MLLIFICCSCAHVPKSNVHIECRVLRLSSFEFKLVPRATPVRGLLWVRDWFALSSAHEKLDVWTGPKWHKLSKWFTICRLGMQFFMRNKIENTENYLSYLLEKWRIEIKIVCTINKNHVENILYLIPLHYPLKFNKTYFTVSDKIALSEISSPIKTSMCRFKPSLHKQILCGNFHLSQKLTRLGPVVSKAFSLNGG